MAQWLRANTVEFDELTDLPTMMYFRRYAGMYIAVARRRGRDVYLLYFNLENFSQFNERYGYEEGDKLLTLTSVAISSAFPGFLLSRIAEDHFLLICESYDLEGSILEVREQVHAYGRNANLELKVGIVSIEDGEVDIGVTCDHARTACESISHHYDRTFRYYDSVLDWQTERRHYIESNFERAIRKGWIKVFFQPIVRTVTGRVCEFEALARWDDPQYGLLSPGVFIEVLEQAHLIHRLDAHVIDLVCAEWHRLNVSDPWLVPVSINLSRLDFELCDIFEMVEGIARRHSVPRQMLHLEVTESALNENTDLLSRKVQSLRDAGYQVWLDDFGSGYSSLNTLKDFVFDVVKIDMAFLREFEAKPKSRVIIASIVNMAKQLGMQTLIEGVETPAQFEFLRDIGCELAQGYLIGRPMPSDRNIERILVGELSMEHASLHGYYDRVGAVNSLSATPFEFSWDKAKHERLLAEMLPLALLERRGNDVQFLTANESFLGMVRELEYDSLASMAETINRAETVQARSLQAAFETAIASGKIESLDLLDNGRHCMVRMRLIASHEGADALLLSIINLSHFSSMGEEQRLQVALRYQYTVYDEVDVIDLGDSTLSVLYRGRTSFPAVPQGADAQGSIREFANDAIHPSDRDRYLAFMDYATVDERVAYNERGYLVDAFRAMESGGTYAWYTMALVPVAVEHLRMVMVCVRRTNERVLSTVSGETEMPKSLLWDTLLELVPAGVFWKDVDRRFLGVNQNFLDFYEFDSVNELLGKTDEDMGWHVDEGPFMSDEQYVLQKGEPVLNAHGTCIARGEVHEIRASKIPLRENGRIVGLLGYFTDLTGGASGSRSESFNGFERMAEIDQLTGIPNLRGLASSAVVYEEAYAKSGTDFAYVVVEIRDMNGLREVYGHSFGNRMLKVVAGEVSRLYGVSGVVARLGGATFAALRQVAGEDEARKEALRVGSAVRGIREVDGILVSLECSLGWALYSECSGMDELMALADERLHADRCDGE